MIPRITPTVVVCGLGAAVTGALLALPPTDDDTTPVPVATVPGGAAAPVSITIADFSFGGPRTVVAGAVVHVSNADAEAHTLTAGDGTFDTGSVEEGTVVSFTAPTVPGTYAFFCDIHPSMTGSLVVGPLDDQES
jgi:plastocyanin